MYDVSSYLNDHPGGAEVMLEVAGQDATNMFEDIGHSSDAREEMKKYEIGLLKVCSAETLWQPYAVTARMTGERVLITWGRLAAVVHLQHMPG